MSKKGGPRLIPRPDGRGALLSGGTPGHKGGGGRPPNALREELRQGLDRAVPSILAAAEDEKHPHYKWAVELCSKYGLGLRHELEVEQRPEVDVDVLRARIEAMLPRVDNDEPSRTLPLPTGE